jgi:glutathione S-transferase
LFIDDLYLVESLPIIEYLDETRPDKELPLYGNNAYER